MKKSFPSIVDVNFTANIEVLLDNIEEGTIGWKTVVSNFYPDLETAVNTAVNELEKVKIADEVTDEICEFCGRNMVVKYGAYGKFLACPGFPDCKNAKPYLRKFYACEAGPECDYMSWKKPSSDNN